MFMTILDFILAGMFLARDLPLANPVCQLKMTVIFLGLLPFIICCKATVK